MQIMKYAGQKDVNGHGGMSQQSDITDASGLEGGFFEICGGNLSAFFNITSR